MGIHPKRIAGIWDEGYVLDKHMEHSELIGEDEYGRPEFSNTRTELGELVFQFKYRFKREKLEEIMRLIQPFLDEWKVLPSVTFVFPVPASVERDSYQPTYQIAYEIADYIGAKYADDILMKTSSQQLKGLSAAEKAKAISGSIVQTRKAKKSHSILIVDDLFDSGSTLNECASVLRKDNLIEKIYVLTMTQTKR